MTGWKVKMEYKAEAELTQLLKDKIITLSDIKVLLQWVSEMEEFGPEYIAQSNEWYGHRSSAFSKSGRIIYKILNDEIIVQVARVTTDHNYRK